MGGGWAEVVPGVLGVVDRLLLDDSEGRGFDDAGLVEGEGAADAEEVEAVISRYAFADGAAIGDDGVQKVVVERVSTPS